MTWARLTACVVGATLIAAGAPHRGDVRTEHPSGQPAPSQERGETEEVRPELDREPELDRRLERFDEAFALWQALRSATLATGDSDEVRSAAASAVVAFLRIEPETVGRRQRLLQAARAARGAGEFEFGLSWLDEARARGIAEPALVTETLSCLLAAGRADDALVSAEAWSRSYPTTVAAFILEARFLDRGALFEAAGARLRRGDHELGRFAFSTAAESGAALDLANLALTLRSLGDSDEALRLYRRAVELAPSDAVLWNDYGMCLRVVGSYDEAAEALEQSRRVEDGPGRGPGSTNLLLMHKLRQPFASGDPEGLADSVLRSRPEQDLVRRFQLDLCLDRF